jgi:hypothetical protein
VTNADDGDTAALVVSPSAGLVTSEAGGSALFTVALATEPASEVRLSVVSGDAGEGIPSLAELVFTPETWSAAQTVTVHGQQDAVADGDVDYSLTLDALPGSDPAYFALPARTVALTNTDDELPGLFVGAPSGTEVSEDGTTVVVTFTVVLTAEPAADVTVPISTSDDTEAIADPTVLTFTSANWDSPQTVTVRGVQDPDSEGAVVDVLIGPSGSSHPSYQGVGAAGFIVTTVDDDV